MTFAAKLKTIRKRAGMSQEKLAELLGVSRQAVTKWETDAGIPDMENIIAISKLFHISIDELLSAEKGAYEQKDYLFESITEYDIDRPKRYDMKLGGANTLVLSGYDGEKIRVCLATNTLETLQRDFKLKIDDVKNCESIELDTKTRNVILNQVTGTVELNCNLDMNIVCHSLNSSVEINQVSATSRICVPKGIPFTAVAKGMGTSITYEKDCEKTKTADGEEPDNRIELNGIKSELVIATF